MVKDTCKQERKTQLQQVGTLQSSAERHNNREADSGHSSTCVAGAGAKQQAAGARVARGDLPAGQRRAAPPAGTPTRAPSRETGPRPPVPSKEPAAEVWDPMAGPAQPGHVAPLHPYTVPPHIRLCGHSLLPSASPQACPEPAGCVRSDTTT